MPLPRPSAESVQLARRETAGRLPLDTREWWLLSSTRLGRTSSGRDLVNTYESCLSAAEKQPTAARAGWSLRERLSRLQELMRGRWVEFAA